MSESASLIGRPRCAGHFHWLALMLAAPALCLGQQVNPDNVSSGGTPATRSAGSGVPAAELPNAGLPDFAPSFGGLIRAAGLASTPLEYTRYGAAVGLGATDNVNSSATHSKSQALAAANFFFDLIRTGSRLEVIALGDFSDINYLEHAYSNQVLGRFDGLAKATLWQDHLKWLVRDSYGDEQINPLEAMTPNNLERVNIFSTGPDLTVRPTPSSFVDMRALYGRNSYQRNPFDGQTETGSVAVGHHLSPVSTVSLNAVVEQLNFANKTVNRNYQRREYYGRYDLRGARTAVDLDAGASQANYLGSWKTSPLARLSLTRNVSAFSTVTLAGGREYSDATGSFADLSAEGAAGTAVGPAALTTANSTHTYGNAAWAFHRARTTVDLSGGWERRTYDGSNAIYGDSREDVALNLGRHLTPTLSANLLAVLNRSNYFNQGFTDKFGTVGGGFVYRPGRWFVIYGRYDHQIRRPSGAAGKGLSSDENRAFIMFGYYPHSSGTGFPGMGGSAGIPGVQGF